MNQGSVLSGSTASRAVEFPEIRANRSGVEQPVPKGAAQFDSIFAQFRHEPSTAHQYQGEQLSANGNLKEESSLTRKTETAERREESNESQPSKEGSAESAKETSVERDSVSAREGNTSTESQQENSAEDSKSSDGEKAVVADGNTAKKEQEAGSDAAKAKGKGETPAATSGSEKAQPQLSSTMALKAQGQVRSQSPQKQSTVTGDENTKSTPGGKSEDVAEANAKGKGKATPVPQAVTDPKSAAVAETKAIPPAEQASKASAVIAKRVANAENTVGNPQKSKGGMPEVAADKKSDGKAKVELPAGFTKPNAAEAAELAKAVKKGTSKSAKSSTGRVETGASPVAESLKTMSKTASGAEEIKFARLESEIGIKAAEQVASKAKQMAANSNNNDNNASERGFLRDSSESGVINRAQAVVSRSDSQGFFNQGHQHQERGRDTYSQNRGGEQLRQWIDGNSEVKGTSQAAQQTQLVDKQAGSVLSARVLNQIVNHIEKLRDSERNRVKVSLGSEANGVTVDIRIDGDAIYTSFEGDESILSQLKDEWADIAERASRKGVNLLTPEYISYSSSSGSESFLPDGGMKEEKSQSVIQHKNNQPVRPGEMTAVAGNSGPVHSYA